MKKIALAATLAMAALAGQAQELRHIQPEDVDLMPSEAVMKEYYALRAKEEKEADKMTEAEFQRLTEIMEGSALLTDLYSGYCSWYCGGDVKRVTASSHLKSQGRFNYLPQNAHDFDHESVWAEGVPGQGIGQWLDYEFEGACPRITHVTIASGHVKTQAAWEANSRPKQIKVYYLGKPYAILDLQDIRGVQWFDLTTPLPPAEAKKAEENNEYPFIALGYHDPDNPSWHLRFEIMEVYPGTKYEDTVISELYFDGIDVH